MVDVHKRRRPKGRRKGPRAERPAQREDRSGSRVAANPGRVAAIQALMAVDEGKHLEDVLPTLLPAEPRDRGFGWFLAFGVLRRRGQIDTALRALVHQPLSEMDPGVRATLRVGAFESFFGRAKDHAVVSQAVEAARAVGVGRASGLVNAVLRNLAKAEAPELPDRATDPMLWAGVVCSHPRWIVEQMAATILDLKKQGLTVLLSEQNLHFARRVADRAYIIEKGEVRYHGTMTELSANAEVRDAYLAV